MMTYDYDQYGVRLNVGDIVKPRDGTSYRGRVIFISEAELTVRHQCLRTGTVYEKCYYTFGVKYEKE